MTHRLKSKPGFDDSCRSGTTDLDFSASERSGFDMELKPRSSPGFNAQQKSPFGRSSTASTVSFDTVTFRKYDVILTDNPSTTSGPPIGLGWSRHQTDVTIDIDAYENLRVPPRSKWDFCLPEQVRWDMLRSAGTSNAELKKASEQVKKHQAKRSRALLRRELFELIVNAIMCILPRNGKKK